MLSTHLSWFTQQRQGLTNRSKRFLSTMSQPVHRFVLFGTGYSGGHLVVDLLRQVADSRYGPLPPTWSVESLLAQRHFFPLHHVQRHGLACSSDLFGFNLSVADLMVTHRMTEPHRFMELLRDQGYRVIYLQRRDLMRHAIATLKAQNFKTKKLKANNPARRHLDPAALLTTLKQLDEQRIAEAAIIAQVSHLTITYETDLLDPNVHNATAQRLCHFLALKQRQRAPGAMKLVHQKLSNLVTNYDEIATALGDSEYAYVLTESSAKLVG